MPFSEETIYISYSLLSLFRNCQRAAYWRYVKGLHEQQKSSKALNYGTLIHNLLDIWHSTYDFSKVEDFIYKEKESKTLSPDDYIIAKQQMKGYLNRWGHKEEFEIVFLEKEFEADITDLDTMQPIPNVKMFGRIDGLIKKDGEYFLLEHKTATNPKGEYFTKLWSDLQIILYCYYVYKVFNIPCAGVLYNVLSKTATKRKDGETDEEFELRRLQAINKNKTGRTAITQKLKEEDSEFIGRLDECFGDREMFTREYIYINKGMMRRVVSEISEITKTFLSRIKRDRFYMNTDHCFKWGSPCAYYPICSSNDNPNIINNLYEVSPRIPLSLVEMQEDIL